jgi:predicted CxxxxCH...CXXCH cytochrome family protein
MHSGANLGAKYSGGTWGAGNDCSWCHASTTTNIKRVQGQINTPTGMRNVTFTRMTANRTTGNGVNGVFGNDNRTYAINVSTNVCEVCHHQTTYHQYSSSKVTITKNHQNANNTECIACHKHAAGFSGGGACDSCHGNPPGALVSPSTGIVSAGAHTVHSTGRGIACDTCHINNGMPATDNKINIGFAVNAANWPSFPGAAGTIAYGSYTGKTLNNGYTYAQGNPTTAVITAAAGRDSCNVYCHGNWAGANGNNNPSWTGGSTQATCGTCHGTSAAQAPTTGSHSKHAAVSGYSYSCSLCHPTYSNNDHVDGNVAWKFNRSDLKVGATATYKAISSGRTGSIALGTAFGDCATVYCHSNGLATSPTYVPTLTWGTASEGACGTCHGVLAATPPASAAHLKHVGTAAGYLFSCSKCHSTVVSATANSTTVATITSTTLHVDKAFAIAYDSFNTGATSCQTTYCHSQGTGATGQPGDVRVILAPITAPTWGTAASCSMCHTGGTTSGPTYLSGSPKANSHSVHSVTNGYTCNICHYLTTTNGTTITAATAAKHANKVYDVSPDPTHSFTYTYASTGGTCKTSTCHGGAAINLAWGASLGTNQCTKCHGDQNTSYIATYSDYSSAVIAPGYNGVGHDTAGNTAATSPRVGTHQQHLLAQSQMSQVVHCGECHTVHTTVQDATHLNYTTATLSFGPLAKTAGHTPTVSRVSGVITCSTVYCHEGTRPAGTGVGQRGTIATTWAFNGASILNNTTIAGTCTDKCHGMPPGRTVVGDQHYNFVAPTTVASLSACSSQIGGTGCHPSLKVRVGVTNFTNLTSVFMNKGALHINGTVEGGSCTGCHATTQGNRVAVVNQFTGNGNSHHYQGTAPIDGKTCYVCHWEADSSGNKTAYHQASGNVELVVWNGIIRPPTYTAGVTAVQYLSGGAAASARTELLKINNHCLGCHNENNKAIAPFTAVGDAATTSKYSWEALATTKGGLGLTAQSIDIKYSDLLTTPWGKLTGNYTNAKSGQTKAFSAHGNAKVNQRGWSTLMENAQGAAVANYPNTSGSTNNVLCFDCHNSHGSESTQPANAVTTSYSSATGRGKGGILKTTIAGKGGYTVSYRPYTGGNAAQKNTYKTGAGLCFDCHNNATVGSPTSTGYSTPWGYGLITSGGTFDSTAKIHGYNDNPYFGKAGGTFARGTTYPYIGTGLPTNKGGHFGASYPLTTPTNNNLKIGGLCTPCHDPHGVSPGILAANKQYAVPMLKETFVTSPYKMDAAAVNTNHGGGNKVTAISTAATAGYHIDQNTMQAATTGCPTTALKWNFATSAATLNTLTDTQFAGLCMKCHAKASLQNTAPATSANWRTMTRIHNSVKGWATTGGGNAANAKHAYTCSKCHSTHNSNLPRLLVTNCLDARHKNRSPTAITPTAATIGPFTGSASSGNGLGRFPGGGAAAATGSRTSGPGPWFFGTSGTAATQTCHDSATAGGTTFDPAGTSQQWNTKSLW